MAIIGKVNRWWKDEPGVVHQSIRRICPLCGDSGPTTNASDSWGDRSEAKFQTLMVRDLCEKCLALCRLIKAVCSEHRQAPEIKALKAGIHKLLLSGKEGIREMAKQYAVTAQEFPREVARVIGKTFAVRGDAALDKRSGGLSDDAATSMIRDLLIELDEQLLEQEKDKPIRRRS